jgi:hypothetical protein
MGTTIFCVLCSERPEYNSKIRAMFGLGPAAFISHMKSPVFQLFFKTADQIGVSCQLI